MFLVGVFFFSMGSINLARHSLTSYSNFHAASGNCIAKENGDALLRRQAHTAGEAGKGICQTSAKTQRLSWYCSMLNIKLLTPNLK